MLSIEQLIQAALEARTRAYATYSGYSVGAALESDSGRIIVGCNVENLSSGATICAERSAIVSMISQGAGRKLRQIAVATLDGVTPCGICLQVLQEFRPNGEDLLIHCATESGEVRSYTLRDLMPYAFESNSVRRTDPAG